jgi:excisionase family DNA binding protein
VNARDQLAGLLAPDVIDALEALVAERVREEIAANGPNGDSSPWLTLDEAAEYLTVSVRTIERRIKSGRLRSTTIGRRRLLHRDDLDELAAATREDVIAKPRRTSPPQAKPRDR